jgi:ubiquinol oxidase
VYYFVLVALWLASPSLAYNFSELIEAHAVDTYSEFRDANAELLASLPAPQVAKLYYSGTDLYLFDEFQSQALKGERRPPVETLLDVFNQIVLDEGAHVDTMQACQDASIRVRSPNDGVPTPAEINNRERKVN